MWREEAIRQQIETIAAAPPGSCPTCAAHGLASIASDPAFKQADPSLEFRDAENLTALLIALDVWVSRGQVPFIQDETHRVFANTLQTVQAVYQAAELGVEPDARRDWTAVSLTLDELRAVAARAPGFTLVHLGGNHYARVLQAGEGVVAYEQIVTDGGGYRPRQFSMPWTDFASRWMSPGRQGVALVALSPGEHSIPGRILRPWELQRIIGCCGVSNASGVEWFFSRSDASRRIVECLESRGFDNYANARKFSMTLPYGFFTEKGYEQARALLRQRVQGAEASGRGNIVIVPPHEPPVGAGEHERTRAEQGVVRFFAISRGVGSASANRERIRRDIGEQVRAVAEIVYGTDIEVRQGAYEGHWHVLVRGINRLVTVMEEAAMDHTRYKTKGGDRAENAHHWPWKGISGGMNGDWETYEYFKEVLVAEFSELFEGTTDSEVLFHVIGDLAEVKDPQGHVIGRVPLEVAIMRTFRLIENIEALVRASEVLQKSYGKDAVTRDEQARVRAKLAQLGIDVAPLQQTEQVAFGQGKMGRKQIPLLVRRMIRAAIENPALYDQEATAQNGWQGYYRMLGAQLPQTRDRRFDNHKMLNISINVASLHDPHNAVVARAYDKSTSFSFGFGRNERGELVQILGGSEVRGFAPLIGIPELSVPIRERIVDLVNGKAEQLKAGPWSVYTVDGVTLTRHGVWDGTVQTYPQGETLRVKWTHVQPGKDEEHRQWTAFRLESQAQPITLKLTLDALTTVDATGARLIRLREAIHRDGPLAQKLRAALANPETLIYGGASGTSYHALSLIEQQHHLFTRVDTSDKWNSTLPEAAIRWEVEQGRPPIFVIVSQSGETGAARTLAKRVKDLGGLVIVMTNRPGSSLYVEAQQFGYGVIVTESLDETAVAATGSNVSQVLALRILAWLRDELVAPPLQRREITRQHGQRLDDVLTLTTYRQPDGEVHRGQLETILDGFDPGQPGDRLVNQTVRFINAPSGGLEEAVAEKTAFRHTNFIFTGVDPVGYTIAMEHALKVMEVTRRMAVAIPLPQLLAYGIGDADPRQRHVPWDAQAAIATAEANLQRYTTGVSDHIGRYPHVAAFPRGQDQALAQATEVLLVGDGEDMMVLDYLSTRYQPTTLPIPIRDAHYHAAPPRVRKGAVVIAVQPWAREHVELLESYRDQGATIVVAGSPQRPLAPGARQLAERQGAFLPIEGTERVFGEVVVLDLLMLRVQEAVLSAMDRQLAESMRGVVEQGVERLRQQIGGMKTVVESFAESAAGATPHRNRIALDRLKVWTRARGWQHFDWWATGKGLTVPAARDLQLLASAATGKLMESAETSEFKHGRYAATNYGDLYINYWPEQGTPDWADNRKTSIEEVVPRAAQYPYPIYNDREPGMIVLVGRENPDDPDLRHLSDDEYRELRTLRRQAEDVEAVKRADVVFVTPHGEFLELLSLNQLLVGSLAKTMFEDLKDRGLSWEQAAPRTVVFNVDTGTPMEGKTGLYQALRASFDTARRSQIVTVAPEATGMPAFFSSQVIPVDSKDPIAFLVVGHQLTTALVNARFRGVLEYLVRLTAALRKDLERSAQGIIGRVTLLFRTPSELMMEYAKGNPDAVRAVKAFAAMGPEEFRDVEARLADVLDWYNIDPIKAIGAASSMPELRHAVVDLIEKLAKVVVNFSPIVVGGPAKAPIPLFSATLGGAFFIEQAGLDHVKTDPETVDEIREIVRDALGSHAAAGTPDEVFSAFVTLAQRRLREISLTLRDQYPGLPPEMGVTLHLYGNRLAHQQDGRLLLNVHALRHPLLAFQQLEHEGVHEVLGPAIARLSLPDELKTAGVPDEQVREVLGEMAVMTNEVNRVLSYPDRGRHGVLEVLQGPNVVDATGVFQQLLERALQAPPTQSLTPDILAALKDARPDRVAAIESLQQVYAKTPAVVERVLEELHRALAAAQRFVRLDVNVVGDHLVALPPQEALQTGQIEVNTWLTTLEAQGEVFRSPLERVFTQLHQTGQSKWDIFPEVGAEGQKTGKTLIALAMWDHPGIANALIEPTRALNRDIAHITKLTIPGLARPVAVGIFRIEAELSPAVKAAINSGLQRIADRLKARPTGNEADAEVAAAGVAPSAVADAGVGEIEDEFGGNPDIDLAVVSRSISSYQTFQASGSPQLEVFADPINPAETVVIAVLNDHHGIGRAILDLLDDAGFNNELVAAKKIRRDTLAPIAVILIRVEATLARFDESRKGQMSLRKMIGDRLAIIAVDVWLAQRGRHTEEERAALLQLYARHQTAGGYHQLVPQIPPETPATQVVSVYAVFPNATRYTGAPGQTEPEVAIQEAVRTYTAARGREAPLTIGKFYAAYHTGPEDPGIGFVQLKLAVGDLQDPQLNLVEGLREILRPLVRSEESGLEESPAQAAARATAAMRTAYEGYQRLYETLQSAQSPLFQSVPTLADVETTLITRGVKEQQCSEVHGTLLAMLGGPILTIKDAEGSDGDTVRAMRQVLLDAANALAPLVPPDRAQAWQIHYPQPSSPASGSRAGPAQPSEGGLEETRAATVTAFPRLQVTLTEAGVARQLVGTETVLQPQLAVLAGKALNDALGLAAVFQWPSALPVVMVARDADHQSAIEAGLRVLPESARIQVLKVVHVAPGTPWNPDGLDYAAAAQRVADQLKTSGFASYHIRLFLTQSLWEIAQFLGLPIGGASHQMFQQLEQQSDGIFA